MQTHRPSQNPHTFKTPLFSFDNRKLKEKLTAWKGRQREGITVKNFALFRADAGQALQAGDFGRDAKELYTVKKPALTSEYGRREPVAGSPPITSYFSLLTLYRPSPTRPTRMVKSQVMVRGAAGSPQAARSASTSCSVRRRFASRTLSPPTRCAGTRTGAPGSSRRSWRRGERRSPGRGTGWWCTPRPRGAAPGASRGR